MSAKLDYPNPLKNSGKFFTLPAVRQFTAGPCNITTQVSTAMLTQPLSRVNKYYNKLLMEIQEMVKYIYQTSNPITFVAQTSGTGGNETMIRNLADPGETVLVATSGVWGARVADMARRYNLNVIETSSKPGEVYSFEELEELIIKHRPVTLFITHGESSSGVLQPLDGLGKICHKYNCLLAVDAVVSAAVVPLLVDKWEIDAVNGGSQKGIGAPAGMVLMSFSPRAHKRMLEKKCPPPCEIDVLSLIKAWQCLENTTGQILECPYTYGTPMLAAVRQALAEICEEGLENVWERHRKCSDIFISKLDNLGMKHIIEKAENRFCGINCVVLPSDVQLMLFHKVLSEKHEIQAGFGFGPTKEAVRIGFLCQNAKPDLVDYFTEALEDTLNTCRIIQNSPEFDSEVTLI